MSRGSQIVGLVPLTDHHCHGLLRSDISREQFAVFGSESDWEAPEGTDALDSPFGLAVRRICAPVLDLPRHSSIDDYVVRRLELGHDEVNRRLIGASGIGRFLIETGFPAASIASPADMGELSGRRADPVVRLEAIAESVAKTTTAATFISDFAAELRRQLIGAVGVKTVAAYRFGLELEATPPQHADVTAAVGSWLSEAEASGRYRLVNPVILNHIIWEAVELQTVIQVHVGFGDDDVQLNRADPSLLTPFLRATRLSGARIALLHCYPFVREAAILAHLFPHVYFDVSCVSHYAGPFVPTLLKEALEVAPFSKLLFASDAYGLAEHYLVSATMWRAGLVPLVDEWLADDWITPAEAERIVRLIGSGNAAQLYRLGANA